MRYLVLVATLLLAANALADKQPASAAKELDKSSPQLMQTDSPDAADAKEKHNRAKGRAQDYNSSRSNTTAAAGLHKEGVVHRDLASRNVDASDAGLDRATEASEGKVRAQDYNSSRSNTTAVREDKEGDLEQDSEDDRDTVVRKKPGKR